MHGLVVLLGELAETERHLDGDRGLGVHEDYTKLSDSGRLNSEQQQNGGFANKLAK